MFKKLKLRIGMYTPITVNHQVLVAFKISNLMLSR